MPKRIMDPEYVSGGGAGKNIEEKVVAVFDREFALALQQVDVKDQDQLVLGFCLIYVNLSRKRRSWQRSTKESLKSAGQSVGTFSKLYQKIICLLKSNMP